MKPLIVNTLLKNIIRNKDRSILACILDDDSLQILSRLTKMII